MDRKSSTLVSASGYSFIQKLFNVKCITSYGSQSRIQTSLLCHASTINISLNNQGPSSSHHNFPNAVVSFKRGTRYTKCLYGNRRHDYEFLPQAEEGLEPMYSSSLANTLLSILHKKKAAGPSPEAMC